MLPLGILLIGVMAVMAFIAVRPWPATPSGQAIKPGAYVIEILQGHPPAASVPADKQSQITEIENGLMAAVIIWFISKLATGVSSLLALFGGE